MLRAQGLAVYHKEEYVNASLSNFVRSARS